MKKTTLYYVMLFTLPVLGFIFIGNSAGKTGGFSGSPGDANTTCSQCHSGGSFNAVASLSTDIPVTGYVHGQTYNITLSVSSTSSKVGFQMTAENSLNAKTGTFIAGTGSQVVNGGTAVTHTFAGTSMNSWTFQWVAPSSGGTLAKFYAAVNATNGDGATSGDQIVTVSRFFDVNLGSESFKSISFSVFPNPSSETIFFNGLEDFNSLDISISNSNGQIVKDFMLNASNSSIDVSHLNAGIYFIHVISDEKYGVSKFIKK